MTNPDTHYRRIAQLRSADDFRTYVRSLGLQFPIDETLQTGPDAPLAQPLTVNNRTIGNRFAVLPMEGWDGTLDGHPTELVTRRWQHFGLSGAKLIWGGEAVAVHPEGRANPNQLLISSDTVGELTTLRETLVASHRDQFGNVDDLVIGLQLTHSGRFARPHDKKQLAPKILYRHPLLDRKFNLPADQPVLSDAEIADIIEQIVQAAVLAQQAGFHFVDIKHCHGYLGHEFLTAVDRPGHYGGSFENRTRFLREIVAGIRREAPGLDIGVRLSAIDWIPFHPDASGYGEPEVWNGTAYPYAFGGDGTGTGFDLTEPYAFLDLLASLNIKLACITVGSPYYTPHIQRPALFPPSDGYLPPEDPLVGVARQIAVVAKLKHHCPDLILVGSGYSYLQDWLPNVAQAVISEQQADMIGLGRMMLSYPTLPADVLAGKTLQRKRLCRTFSDCTTAPRNGMVSGCYPLDDFYKGRADAKTLIELKQQTLPNSQPLSPVKTLKGSL